MIQRHKDFIEEYLSNGKNATEAYKKIYPRCKSGHSQSASQLLATPKIAARLNSRLKKIAAKADFTVKKCLKEYEAERVLASAAGQHAAAVQAITGKAKLFGMHVTHTIIEDKTTPLSDEDRENFEKAAREMNVKLAAG